MVGKRPRVAKEDSPEPEEIPKRPQNSVLVNLVRQIVQGRSSLREILMFGTQLEVKKATKYWVILNAIQQDIKEYQRAPELPRLPECKLPDCPKQRPPFSFGDPEVDS